MRCFDNGVSTQTSDDPGIVGKLTQMLGHVLNTVPYAEATDPLEAEQIHSRLCSVARDMHRELEREMRRRIAANQTETAAIRNDIRLCQQIIADLDEIEPHSRLSGSTMRRAVDEALGMCQTLAGVS